MISSIARWKSLGRLAIAIPAILGAVVFPATDALAVPSMARQTGYECGKCHTVFPELNQFGRNFKLGAFAMTSDKWDAKPLAERIPVSAALLLSQTNTSDTRAGGVERDEFPKDGKPIVQTAAIYYGGKLFNNAGALVQYNYDSLEKIWAMEMFDARYGNSFTLADEELAWGVTFNNSPTVSDIYNSTSVWGFPHTGTAAEQGPERSLIDGTLASRVGGVGLYGSWNNMLYAELAGYRAARNGAFRFMGWGIPADELAEDAIKGIAPYWRLALQQDWGPHSLAVGTYGLVAKAWENANDKSLGANKYRDIGYDANYQFIQGDHAASVRLNWIKEKKTWASNLVGEDASNPVNKLNTFRADLKYFFRRQWGGGLQYFKTTGTSDDLRYNDGRDVLTGGDSGSPNTKGWIGELNYLPWQNVKLALRYTKYDQYYGASNNYRPGRDASDNNTLYLMGWILF